MLTVQNLKEFGANVEEGLQRCYGNEALYIRLCGTIPTEKKFDELAAALEAKDLDTAFDTAHALKGVLGNLCLSPMYEKVVDITEFLRARTDMDYSKKIADILADRDRLRNIAE